MTTEPANQTLSLDGGGIDANAPTDPDALAVAEDQWHRDQPAHDADEQADRERAALLAAGDAGGNSEQDYRDAQWDTLDQAADFLACDSPLTICAAQHDHRDVGDMRAGGVWRGAVHAHGEMGGSGPALAAHITDVHGHGTMTGATGPELAEQHVTLHAIDDDARRAFRSTASLGAVLAGLIKGDWLEALDELRAEAARQATGDEPDLEPITALLWTVEKARGALHLAEDELKATLSTIIRRDLALSGPVAVAGFGTLEAKAGAKRTNWDKSRALSAVATVGMQRAGIVDAETGELDVDRAADYQLGAGDVLAATTPSIRVGGLASFGLDAGDYCDTEYGRATVIARWNDGL